MHVNSSAVARGGILTALSVICMLFASFFPFSSLFFALIAACVTAMAYDFSDLRFGIAALIASALLGAFLSPRKGIVAVFIGLALYLVFAQVIERHFYNRGMTIYWGIKCLVFNALFWAAFFIAYGLVGLTGIFSEKALEYIESLPNRGILVIGLIVLVEVLFVVIDRVYFMIRNRLYIVLKEK